MQCHSFPMGINRTTFGFGHSVLVGIKPPHSYLMGFREFIPLTSEFHHRTPPQTNLPPPHIRIYSGIPPPICEYCTAQYPPYPNETPYIRIWRIKTPQIRMSLYPKSITVSSSSLLGGRIISSTAQSSNSAVGAMELYGTSAGP